MADTVDWGAILNNVLGLAPAVLSGIQGGQAVGQGREAAALADPFASQRPQYQDLLSSTFGHQANPYETQLLQLLNEPGSFKVDPGYQFALEQGQNAISRGSNALYGTGRTGSLGPELAKFTEGYANQAFNNRINQLLQGTQQQDVYNTNQINQLLRAAGADTGDPATAGKLLIGGYQGRQAGMANALYGLGGGYGGGGLGGILNSVLGRSGGGGGIINNNTGTGIDWNNPLAGWGGTPADPWYGGLDTINLNTGSGIDWSNPFADWGGSFVDPWYG